MPTGGGFYSDEQERISEPPRGPSGNANCMIYGVRRSRPTNLPPMRRGELQQAAGQLEKNAWLPGSTIDLGEHEWAFQLESGLEFAQYHGPPASCRGGLVTVDIMTTTGRGTIANRQWACRARQTGQYASPERCLFEPMNDVNWQDK